jgi:hypothetical protein
MSDEAIRIIAYDARLLGFFALVGFIVWLCSKDGT